MNAFRLSQSTDAAERNAAMHPKMHSSIGVNWKKPTGDGIDFLSLDIKRTVRQSIRFIVNSNVGLYGNATALPDAAILQTLSGAWPATAGSKGAGRATNRSDAWRGELLQQYLQGSDKISVCRSSLDRVFVDRKMHAGREAGHPG